jgi:hypothetical protein
MKTNNQQIAHIVVSWILLSVALAFAAAKPALAGPDCDRKPDHPSCSGGGGGEDPPDACAASTTFPTFVYWDNSDNLDRMTLSDADGACQVELLAHDNQHYFAGNSAMHFDNGLGRIVWTDRWPGNEIYLTEFTVGADNAVTVLNPQTLIAQLPHTTVQNHGSILDVDITSDGQSFVFVYASPTPEGATDSGQHSILMSGIDDCLAETWVPADTIDPCNGALTVVHTYGYFPDGDGPYISDVMFSADLSRILFAQFIDAWGSGTYVIDSSDGNWILPPTYHPEIIFPWDTALIDPGDGGGTRELLLVGPGSDSVNYCGDIQVIDLEDCLAGNSCTAIASPPYLSGMDASWLSDGRVVYIERIFKQRGKNVNCSNGDITIADPLDLSVNPDRLFGGWGPLGWW